MLTCSFTLKELPSSLVSGACGLLLNSHSAHVIITLTHEILIFTFMVNPTMPIVASYEEMVQYSFCIKISNSFACILQLLYKKCWYLHTVLDSCFRKPPMALPSSCGCFLLWGGETQCRSSAHSPATLVWKSETQLRQTSWILKRELWHLLHASANISLRVDKGGKRWCP